MATSAAFAATPRIYSSTFADYTEHLNSNRPTLAEQLDDLDNVRSSSDLRAYAAAWTGHAIDNGAAPVAFWRQGSTDGEPVVAIGFDMATATGNLALRHDALRDHADGVEGFREALVDHLIANGFFHDNRVQS